MIGPLLLALSWLLLRIEGRGLASIGIDQPRRRSRELAFGFGFMGAVAAVQQVGLSVASGDRFMYPYEFTGGGQDGAEQWNVAGVFCEVVHGSRFVLELVFVPRQHLCLARSEFGFDAGLALYPIPPPFDAWDGSSNVN